jgi:predicted transcriptional regulator
MTLQKRLQRVMQKRGWRVADLARHFGRPYTSVREWVLHGRDPGDPAIKRKLVKLEHLR